jgi:hypothetical protein
MTCRDEILSRARELLERTGTSTFQLNDLVNFMRLKKSHFAESTIRTHVASRLCVNAPANHDSRYPDFERTETGTYQFAKRNRADR